MWLTPESSWCNPDYRPTRWTGWSSWWCGPPWVWPSLDSEAHRCSRSRHGSSQTCGQWELKMKWRAFKDNSRQSCYPLPKRFHATGIPFKAGMKHVCQLMSELQVILFILMDFFFSCEFWTALSSLYWIQSFQIRLWPFPNMVLILCNCCYQKAFTCDSKTPFLK